jgi:hypothetical protein
MATPYNFKTVKLEFRTPGKEITSRFSDIQDTLRTINWKKVSGITITNIPCHEDPDLEDAVTRLIFNKQQIWELREANKFYEQLVYGE